MSRLPTLSWREVLKALSKAGFKPVRQRGSHIILENPEGKSATVPKATQIKRGTLISIINQAGLTKEQFIKMLNGE